MIVGKARMRPHCRVFRSSNVDRGFQQPPTKAIPFDRIIVSTFLAGPNEPVQQRLQR